VETARQLLEVSSQDEGITIRGFITPISITRSNRREITFFINGRWVADTPLTAAMTQAYHTLLMVGRYPMGFLSIQLPPDDVDVNVHPAKAEVRFRSPDKIFSSLQRAVRRALLAYTPVPSIYHPSLPWNTSSPQAPFNSVWPASMGASGEGFPTVQSAQPELDPDVDGILEPVPQTGQQNAFPGSSLGLLRWVGQIGAAYLVAEGPDGLYLIDQHAAHERVLFERYMAQLQQKILSQGLLQPAAVHLPPHSAALLTDQLELLGQLGFSIEAFGPNTFLVRAIPALLGQVDPAAALSVLVEDFEEDETPLKNEVEARLIARICKRVAVKAGQVLSPDEQKILIRDLENCRSPRTCPHGRPTMIHLSVDLLERQFGRRGSR
jgi:DNA mismatch repair protein MutL